MNALDASFSSPEKSDVSLSPPTPDFGSFARTKELPRLNKSNDTSGASKDPTTLEITSPWNHPTETAPLVGSAGSAASASGQGSDSVGQALLQAGKAIEEKVAHIPQTVFNAGESVTGKIGEALGLKAPPGAVQAEHQQLSDWAAKNLSGDDRKQFQGDLKNFEHRAQKAGLPELEVLKTYQQIERLIAPTAGTPVPQRERQHLAQQVLREAANPSSVCQGGHNSCSVSSLEVRTYTRAPSHAARLVADIALTGQHTAEDGTKVSIDTTAHDESKIWPPIDGVRTHAGEIFQVTAVNLFYARQNAEKGGDTRYIQVNPKPHDEEDTGERLINYATNPPKELARIPDLSNPQIAEISNALTGKNETNIVMQAGGDTAGGATAIDSEAELIQTLRHQKAHNGLPMLVSVNVNNEPFFTDFGKRNVPPVSQHMVTVTDYDPKSGAVNVVDQWQSTVNHGSKNPVHVHDLYTAMQTPADAEKRLKNDVAFNSANNIFAPEKEADLLRHEVSNKDKLSESTVAAKAKDILNEMASQPAQAADNKAAINDLEAVIEGLPAKDRMMLATIANNSKLVNWNWFIGQIHDDPGSSPTK